MPNKYSHSVVLAHYSSLGLIDLPNDQYIAYLKTYPSSRRPSITSYSQSHSVRAKGSVTPSTGYTGRNRILEEHTPSSRSIRGYRDYDGRVERNVIIDPDEEPSDEHLILHKKHEHLQSAPHSSNPLERHELRTEKRRLPSVSTYTGRSSSEAPNGVSSGDTLRQSYFPVKGKSRTSHPSVINLNDYEAEPSRKASLSATVQHGEQPSPPSSGSKGEHISAQVKSVNGRTAPSLTQEIGIYNSNEPNFDGFSDKHFSEATITGIKSVDSSYSLAIPNSQFSQTSTVNPPVSASFNASAHLPKRVDSAPGYNGSPSGQGQPQHNPSFDSISSIDSYDMVHLSTALAPTAPLKSPKTLPTTQRKGIIASQDPEVGEDAIDPSFFETLRDGPPKSSAPPSRQRSAGLYPNFTPSIPQPSHRISRPSSDHAPPNPDFWRELEDMLSDSDGSAAFPPDIAKHKHRDSNATTVAKVDRIMRNGIDDGEVKRPTTAPAPRVSAFATPEPLPEGRSRITVTNHESGGGSLDKPRDARKMTTVQLVDTSAQKKGKKGFLRKLRKKTNSDW